MSVLATRRTRVLAALIVAVLSLSAVPSMVIGGDAVTSVAAADELDVKVGWMSEIVNWNPMYIAMVEDWVSTFLMYSALWQYDENWGNPVPDLALSYNITYHDDGTMTLWVNLTHNAYFRTIADPESTDLPLTANDVVYTIWVASSKTSTAWEYYLRDYDAHVVDTYTVRLDIPFVKATAIDDITGIPIVPDAFYNTSGIALQDSMEPEDCLGSGPFVFDSWLESSWWKFRSAPLTYHGALDFPESRTVLIDTITYSLSASAGNLAIDMNAGVLDVAVLTGEPDIFVSTLLPTPENKMVKEAVQELGICDIAINAVPTEFRVDDKGSGAYNDGNYHLLDPAVRRAILMTLDKAYINTGTMKGLSTQADSVIPKGNYWYLDIQNELEFDVVDARQVLLDAHYYSDGGTYLLAGPDSYVVQNGLLPEGSRLENIRCHAPNTDPSYYDIAAYWETTSEDAGIGLSSEEINEGIMINEEWYKCMYDIWVWHWGWGPEPLSDLSVWQTAEILTGGDNCQMPMGEWYVHGDMDTDGDGDTDVPQNYTTSDFVNASMIEEYGMDQDGFRGFSSFDQNASRAMRTPDMEDRREIVYDLQQMVHDSWCESPPYYDLGLYAYTTVRYQGWGDWSEHSGRTVVSGMPWLWFDLVEAGNTIPTIDLGLSPSYDLYINEEGTFSITVSDVDEDSLWVNWSFGDGSPDENLEHAMTADPLVVSTTHTYTAEDTYILTVTVTDSIVGHDVSDTASVVVTPVPTGAPRITGLEYTPPEAYEGELTTWSFDVTDEDSTTLTVTIAWGDGSYDVIPISGALNTPIPVEETHTFDDADTYSVVISAYDGANNVSASTVYYEVIANAPPTAPVVSEVVDFEMEIVPVYATTSDPDPDELIITWDWEDGTYDVMDPYDNSVDPGSTLEFTVDHTWDTPGDYTFTVYVDDQEGHNVSTPSTATIVPVDTPVKPTILSLVATPSPGIVDEMVTLTISASDANDDPLDFYVEFGDGASDTDSTPAGEGTQTVVMTHVYTAADTYTVSVYVYDNSGLPANNVTKDFTVVVEVEQNDPPELVMTSSYSAKYNETFTVIPTLVSDADDDDVTVWYEWGDETDMTEGDSESDYSATHVYSMTGNLTLTVYADDNTGLDDHNVSETATVTVSSNRKPEIKGFLVSPSGDHYTGDTLTFNVTVSDLEGDDVTIKIDFGDDTAVQSKAEELSGPGANVTVTFTHSYEDAETYTVLVWVEDEYDHPIPEWNSNERDVVINQLAEPKAEINWMLIAGIGILILAVVVVAVMLMKKRKGKAEGGAGEGSGGMEGMAPPQ